MAKPPPYEPEDVAEWRDLLVSGSSYKEISRLATQKLGRNVGHSSVQRRLTADYPLDVARVMAAKAREPVRHVASPKPTPAIQTEETRAPGPAGSTRHVKEPGDPVTWDAILVHTPSLAKHLEGKTFMEIYRETAR